MKNAERYITPELKASSIKALAAAGAPGLREGTLTSKCCSLPAGHLARPVVEDRRAGRLPSSMCWPRPPPPPSGCGLTRPAFTGEDPIEIAALAATLVVESRVEDFIPNDTSLTRSRQLLLITGPNMGGKSTLHAAGGEIALLAHCGSFVPAATAARSTQSSRIGASDDSPADAPRSWWR